MFPGNGNSLENDGVAVAGGAGCQCKKTTGALTIVMHFPSCKFFFSRPLKGKSRLWERRISSNTVILLSYHAEN
jgi:hypothetical protein